MSYGVSSSGGLASASSVFHTVVRSKSLVHAGHTWEQVKKVLTSLVNNFSLGSIRMRGNSASESRQSLVYWPLQDLSRSRKTF